LTTRNGESVAQLQRERPATNAAHIGWGLSSVVIVVALLTLMGAAIAIARPAMLLAPHDEITSAVRVYAGYLWARNLTLALALLALLMIGARHALGNLMAVVGLIQIVDAATDVAEQRWPIVPVVLILGVIILIAAARLSGAAFWKRAAWVRGN
jgi:hypothetical protein